MKDVFYFELDGEKREYHVKDDVPFTALLVAINEALTICYADDGEFHPELEDFAKEYVIIKTLTDIELPDNADEAYRYIRAIDGVCSVDADFIADGIRQRINYNTRLLIASIHSVGTNRLADDFGGLITNLTDLVDRGTSILDSIASQVESGEFADINKLVGVIEKLNVSPEQLAAAMINTSRQAKKPAKKAAKKPE